MKKAKLCANGSARQTGTGQNLYTRDPCKNPADRGHIHCTPCRIAAGGYNLNPRGTR